MGGALGSPGQRLYLQGSAGDGFLGLRTVLRSACCFRLLCALHAAPLTASAAAARRAARCNTAAALLRRYQCCQSYPPPRLCPAYRQLDIEACRQLLLSLLAATPPGTKAYIYCYESVTGGAPGTAPNPYGAARVEYNTKELQAVVTDLPGVVAHTGHVLSNALARTLRLPDRLKHQRPGLRVALAAFPQAAPRIRWADGPGRGWLVCEGEPDMCLAQCGLLG